MYTANMISAVQLAREDSVPWQQAGGQFPMATGWGTVREQSVSSQSASHLVVEQFRVTDSIVYADD